MYLMELTVAASVSGRITHSPSELRPSVATLSQMSSRRPITQDMSEADSLPYLLRHP